MDINYNMDYTYIKKDIQSSILTYGYSTYMRLVEEVVCDLKMILNDLPKDDPAAADTTKEIMIATNSATKKVEEKQVPVQPMIKKKLKKVPAGATIQTQSLGN